MIEAGQQRILVPMKVNGLGSATHPPQTMVILLSPLEEDKYSMPNGEQMIFPVGVPREMAPIYFAKMAEKYSDNVQLLEVSHLYELMSETKLQTLNIYQGRHGPRPYIVFKDKEGEENSFRVPLPNGVITAINHNLPILMEEQLLRETAAKVRINKEEGVSTDLKNESPEMSFADLAERINTGEKPGLPLSSEVLHSIGELTSSEREDLMKLAIQNENYEWASILNDIKERNE